MYIQYFEIIIMKFQSCNTQSDKTDASHLKAVESKIHGFWLHAQKNKAHDFHQVCTVWCIYSYWKVKPLWRRRKVCRTRTKRWRNDEDKLSSNRGEGRLLVMRSGESGNGFNSQYLMTQREASISVILCIQYAQSFYVCFTHKPF